MTEVEVLYPITREVFRHDLVGFRRDLHVAWPSDEIPVKRLPDWACEVLSPTTARNGMVKKQRTLISTPSRTTGSSIQSTEH